MSRYTHGSRSSLARAGIARRIDAENLYNAGRFAGAVYLAGYKVECALKVALMEVARVDHLRELEGWLRSRLRVGPETMLHNVEVLSEHHPGVLRMLANPGQPTNREMLKARNDCNRWRAEGRYDPRALDAKSALSRLEAVDKYSAFVRNSL